MRWESASYISNFIITSILFVLVSDSMLLEENGYYLWFRCIYILFKSYDDEIFYFDTCSLWVQFFGFSQLYTYFETVPKH